MNPHFISTALFAAHWLVVIGLSLRVITRRTPVGVSAAWIAVMFSVPFLGAAVYLLFGERRLGWRRAARISAGAGAERRWQDSLRLPGEESKSALGPSEGSLERLAERVLGFPAQEGNELELLDDYHQIFDALVADIDQAKETCHLSFFIWYEGGRVADVAEALLRAARRGVRCRALADALGSKRFFRGELVRRLQKGGVQFRAALPIGPMRALLARVDLRYHRKNVVIDGRVAYAGSQNLVDPRWFKRSSGAGQWIDAMARITGPAARALEAVFALDWSVESGMAFEAPGPLESARRPVTGAKVQVAPSGPDLRPEAIHQLLLTAIYGARRELVLTTPYFVPDDSMLAALLSAALRGVEVTLVVPARNDSRLVRYASVAHFDELLSSGVRIALFEGGLLHTKSLAIDGETSLFGSVNLDMRSLWLNFEISLLVYDTGFTRRLRSLQNRYLEDSVDLDLESWRRRARWRRLAEDSARLLAPLL